jgi:hypothetical protein
VGQTEHSWIDPAIGHADSDIEVNRRCWQIKTDRRDGSSGMAAGGKFVENVRFAYGPVVFVGLNVPVSNNNVILTAKK